MLRGERPDVFLAAGQRRMVCELCVPRATHEGWTREADGPQPALDEPRGRRALRDLWRPRRPRRDDASADDEYPPPRGAGGPELVSEPPAAFTAPDEDAGVDEPLTPAQGLRPVPEPRPRRAAAYRAGDGVPAPRAPRSVHAVPTNADFKAARALQVFNDGDQPRRIAGLARSLGVPQVSARPITPDSTVMHIVVAWELCWYRYEVDLGDERSGTRLVAQGMELDELEDADRVANATADDRGELRMLAL